jgi:hypothetical protein
LEAHGVVRKKFVVGAIAAVDVGAALDALRVARLVRLSITFCASVTTGAHRTVHLLNQFNQAICVVC